MTTTQDRKPVVHTYASPAGGVVVVRNVPARIRQTSSGETVATYPLSIAVKLDQIITSALEANESRDSIIPVDFANPQSVEYIHPGKDIEVDLGLKFKGPQVKYGEATVKIWKKAFDRIYLALSYLQKGLADTMDDSKVLTGFPVAYAREGSLSIGLRDSDQAELFDVGGGNINYRALSLIVSTTKWLSGEEDALSKDLRENSILFDAALKAIEELSPTDRDEITSVELIQQGKLGAGKPISLTPELRVKAIQHRITLAVESGNGEPISMLGRVVNININGKMIIKDIKESQPEIKSKSITVDYSENLLEDIINSFKSRAPVVLSGIRRKQRNGKYLVEIIDLKIPEADDRTDSLPGDGNAANIIPNTVSNKRRKNQTAT